MVASSSCDAESRKDAHSIHSVLPPPSSYSASSLSSYQPLSSTRQEAISPTTCDKRSCADEAIQQADMTATSNTSTAGRNFLPKADARVRRTRHFVLICFIINLCIFGVVCYMLAQALMDVHTAFERFDRHDTQAVDASVIDLHRLLTDSEASTRGFVIVGEESYLERYNRARPYIEEKRRQLVSITPPASYDRELSLKISELTVQRLYQLDRTVLLRRHEGFAAARKQLINGRGDSVMIKMSALMSQLMGRTHIESRELRIKSRHSLAALWCYFGVNIAILFLSLLLSLLGTSEFNTKALKEQNAALHQLLKKAKESTRLKSQFLANISHEIRTPMNGVSAMAHLLYQTPLNEDQRECVEIIIDSSNSMVNLLNDLLLCSKIGSGRFTLNPAAFHVERLIRHVEGVMQSRLEHKRQQIMESGNQQPILEFKVERLLPPSMVIIADSDRLKQVLLNLIDNAFKFTSEGCIILTVRAMPTEQQEEAAKQETLASASTASCIAASTSLLTSKLISSTPECPTQTDLSSSSITSTSNATVQHKSEPTTGFAASTNEPKPKTAALQVAVSDTGIGMKKETQQKIFDAFSQADMSTTKTYGGTGLGLFVCAQLVHEMGSSLYVESKEGEGSTFDFTITVPLADEEAIQVASSPEVSDIRSSSPPLIEEEQLANVPSMKSKENRFEDATVLPSAPPLTHESSDTLAASSMELSSSINFPILQPFTQPVLDCDYEHLEPATPPPDTMYVQPASSPFALPRRLSSHAFEGKEANTLSHHLYERKLPSGTIYGEAPLPHNIVHATSIESLSPTSASALSPDQLSPSSSSTARLTPTRRTGCSIKSPLRPLRILCAEDNKTNQKVIRKLLTREGHSVVLADNGQIAYELFKEHAHEFDCILLDICMPIWDGRTACRKIRQLEGEWRKQALETESKSSQKSDEHKSSLSITLPAMPPLAPTTTEPQHLSAAPPSFFTRSFTEPASTHSSIRTDRIPIIAVTAWALLEDKKACEEAGMDDVILKPLTPLALSRALRAIITRAEHSINTIDYSRPPFFTDVAQRQ